MKPYRSFTRRLLRALLAAAVAVVSLQFAAGGTASAATISDVNWSVDKAHPGGTSVRYTWTFTTGTQATLSKVTFTVPSGTGGGSLSVADVYGLGAGTAALSGTTVTYSITTPASVASGVKVLVAIGGFTNTSSAGGYTSTVTTYDNAGTPAAVDTGTSNTVTLDGNTTAATVVVVRSTSFTSDTDSFEVLLDPSSTSAKDLTKAVTVAVKTNAGGGYTLAAKATALTTGTYTIGGVSSGVASGVADGSFTVNKWGFKAGALSGDAVGSRQGALATTGNYVGYTTGDETIVSATGPTNDDTVVLTNRVKIDYKQAAGTYTSTITYTLSPSF